MRKGVAPALVVIAFLLVTGILVYLGRGAVPAAVSAGGPGSMATTPQASGTAGAGVAQGSGATGTASYQEGEIRRAASNVPMRKLAKGEKPPQFVLFSFDGAGSHERWQQYLAAAGRAKARFTGFLTGLYLIDNDHRRAYVGPGHAAGKASVSFGGSKRDVLTEVSDLNAAWAAGNEIGTHYNGHFCSDNPPGAADWTAADWTAELDQFDHFVDGWREINGYADAPALAFGADDIKGGRIPCMEADLGAVTPAWLARGYTYDTSKNRYTGIGWPEKLDSGIWEFQLPYAYSPAFDRKVLATDYSMWTLFNGADADPATAPQLTAMVKQTYQYLFSQVYDGNRAPLVIANHFSDWNGGALNDATLAFFGEVCVKPEVVCATYSDVIAWMGLQDPEVLRALQSRPVVATGGS